jgi:RimJ/RimL family protein N-acetyltransferase
MCAYSLITDKNKLERRLRLAPDLNLYHLGDLDDFFWPDTRWFARVDGEEITALALLYSGENPPVLLAIDDRDDGETAALLVDLIPDLPGRVYAHLSPGLIDPFRSRYAVHHHGAHFKMSLIDPIKLERWDTSAVIPLGVEDLPRLRRLYSAAYPGSWFNPRMLKTGQYMGIESNKGRLVAVAGVHVYSQQYRVAALGNITTLPDHRRKGLSTLVTAGCCKRLLADVNLIGLNVRGDNEAAIRTYRKVGFDVVGEYNEWMMGEK